VTYALIAINVAVYALMFPLSFQIASPDDPALQEYLQAIAQEHRLHLGQVQALARQTSRYEVAVFVHGFKPDAPSPLSILTAMFLHGGLMHLLGNMLFLWIYGDNVEHRLGRFGFLLAYLGTGAAAAVGDGLLRMGSGIPSVGASGAISGVLGFYFLWFPHNRVRVWVFFFPFIARIIELSARFVLGIYILWGNLLPLFLTGGAGGVSYGAHIGGFIAGAAVAFVVDRLSTARPEPEVRHRPAEPAPAGGPVQGFRHALDQGRWDLTAEWYFSAPHSVTRDTISPREKTHLGQWLAAHGRPKAALAAFQRALADHPQSPLRVAAHLGAARVLMGSLGNPTGAYQHLYAALEADPNRDEEALARALLAELSRLVRTVPRKLPR
jgi:membrane associated rhomboid family serine protease